MSWEKMVITMFLGILQVVIKNPQKKKELCEDLIHARDVITSMYPNGCEQ
jgi:hypothetical protein